MTPPPDLKPDLAKRIDTLCDEFEALLLDGRSPSIEQFLNRVQPEERFWLLLELALIEDWHLKLSVEAPPISTDDLARRFPEYAKDLQAWFENSDHSSLRDASAADGRRSAWLPRVLANETLITPIENSDRNAENQEHAGDTQDLGTGETVELPLIHPTAQIPEFAGGPLSRLPTIVQRSLFDSMQREPIARGTQIFAEGSRGDRLYVVVEGRITVSSRAAGRDSVELGEVTRGGVLGEMALMGLSQRSADAFTATNAVVLSLTAERFAELCTEHPEVAEVVTTVIADRLGETDQDALYSQSLSGYTISSRLGRGGMGVVYEAYGMEGNRRVALKMMSHRLAFDQFARELFQREAEIIASFSHPNIPCLYERFEAFATSFMAIEYIGGLSLSEVMRQQLCLPLPVIRATIGQLAKALDYAHDRGIVHRDVKPANCMIDESGTVKLLDFGLSVPFRQSPDPQDRVCGTLRYMSPEQVYARSPEPASDWFSLGCVLYELLAHRRLLDAYSIGELKQRFSDWDPAKLARELPESAREFAPVIQQLLSLEPAPRQDAVDTLLSWAAPVPALLS